MMHKKIVAVWVGFAIMFNLILIAEIGYPVKGIIITVDDDGPADYSKIQDAINASSDGDTVFVNEGKYSEDLIINKTINLIGEDKAETTIRCVGNNLYIVTIQKDYVNISGFTFTFELKIYPSWKERTNGIILDNAQHCYFTDNNITGFNTAMKINSTSDNNIISNNKYFNNEMGVGISSHYNTIVNNTFTSNDYYAIALRAGSNFINNNTFKYNEDGIAIRSNNNTVTNNTFTSQGYYAIGLFAKENLISHNQFTDNDHGFYLNDAHHNTISDNNISGSFYGIYLIDSDNNRILRNNVSKSSWGGISLLSSSNNKIGYNLVSENKHGIAVGGCSGNRIYKNRIIDNEDQTSDDFFLFSSNTWEDNYISPPDDDLPPIWFIGIILLAIFSVSFLIVKIYKKFRRKEKSLSEK